MKTERPRYLVVGQLGSGKSTLASKLADRLDLGVIELDEYLWGRGWKRNPLHEVNGSVADAMDSLDQGYVLEGVLVRKLDKELIDRFDGIVVLKIPLWRCFGRAMKRNTLKMIKREKTCGENYETPPSIFYSGVGMIARHATWSREYRKLADDFAERGLEAYVFTSNEDANRWLKLLS